MSRFMENNEGVHLMAGINAEYSVCGDAFDIGSEKGCDDMVETSKKVVTCSRCIVEILNCRGVKINKSKSTNCCKEN